MSTSTQPVGSLLREWRIRRRLSQLDLALDAEISARHLSFLETGRSKPSREMLLRLAEQLQVPLRERNALLNSAGYAPIYKERPISDPEMRSAREAVDVILKGHEPFPALAVDRRWNLVASNRTVAPLLAGADPELLKPPVNVLRLSLHPNGIASRIENYGDWREHLLHRLDRQIRASADEDLRELHNELSAYPAPAGTHERRTIPAEAGSSIAVPFKLRTAAGVLSFFSTTTIFGTPVDVTLSELALESFFPADRFTADVVREIIGAEGLEG